MEKCNPLKIVKTVDYALTIFAELDRLLIKGFLSKSKHSRVG